MLISSRKFESEVLKANGELQTAYTELKENKLTIERLERQAAYASLTMGIAHEVKNPFFILQSSVEMMQENLDDEPTVTTLSERITKACKRIMTILDTMLKYGGPSAAETTSLDIRSILQEVLDLCGPDFAKRGIEVSTECSDIPLINASPTALYQIFFNLINNANQAISSTNQPGKLQIQVSSAANVSASPVVEIRIADNGPGISEAAKTRIFDSFYTTKYGHQGLGLSIVLKLVEEHHGTIQILSDPDRTPGTTFVIQLPA